MPATTLPDANASRLRLKALHQHFGRLQARMRDAGNASETTRWRLEKALRLTAERMAEELADLTGEPD